MFIFFTLWFGWDSCIENLLITDPHLHELWLLFYSMYLIISIAYWMHWKTMVYLFWFIKIIYMVAMHIKFGFMNYIFYLGVASASIFFPFIGVILSKIVLSFMDLLHQNKELVFTIQHILHIFPEAVLIQTKEKSDELKLKFINQTAQVEILDHVKQADNKIEDILNIFVRESNFNSEDGTWTIDDQTNLLKLRDVLDRHRALLDENITPTTSIEVIGDESLASEVQFYDFKTIKVKWESCNDSLMHVLLNTTQVKKYEKEKALNKCLQLMFSSVSHEFRTPLNAFSNALNLIELNIGSLMETIKRHNFQDQKFK